MVCGDKIATRISDNRDIKVSQGVKHVHTPSLVVVKARSFVIIVNQSFIDATAHMFSKTRVDLIRHGAKHSIRVGPDLGRAIGRLCYSLLNLRRFLERKEKTN
jgi:hypothetical protein